MARTLAPTSLSLVLFTAIGLLSLGGGCGQAIFRSAVPASLVEQAEIPDMPRVRYWGDRIDPQLQAEFIRVSKAFPVLPDTRSEEGPGMGGLVLSGGGDCGAYGAGLLCGWTERGVRPDAGNGLAGAPCRRSVRHMIECERDRQNLGTRVAEVSLRLAR